jgi:hypothetical protein
MGKFSSFRLLPLFNSEFLRYTSLGSHQQTSPNAALQAGNAFLPAYLLTDENQERAGRGSIS